MLGYFRVRVRGRDTELPAAAQRLVALLALRDRTSRSRAAGTLWPETTEHRALASLRTEIWRVNQVAPALVYGTCRALLVHGLGIEPSPMAARLLVACEGPRRTAESGSSASSGRRTSSRPAAVEG